MKNETAKLLITTLSPLQIGCDIDYEPTEYIRLDDGRYLTFDHTQLLRVLSKEDKSRLMVAACGDSPQTAISQLIKPYAQKLLATEGVRVIENLAKNPSNWGERANIKRIQRTAFDPLTDRSLLPGSSLKGAIRTAWLASNRSLLKVGIPQDPFRLLTVSDSFAEQEARALCFLQRPHKSPHPDPGSKSSVKYDYLLEANKTGAKFRTEISLAKNPRADLNSPVSSITELVQAMNQHYLPEFEKTRKYLKDMDAKSLWLQRMGTDFDAETKLVRLSTGEEKKGYTKLGLINRNKGFLIRIGKHGGAETLTLPGIRKIKSWSPKTKTTYNVGEYTLTMTLSQGSMEPFGWAFVQLV